MNSAQLFSISCSFHEKWPNNWFTFPPLGLVPLPPREILGLGAGSQKQSFNLLTFITARKRRRGGYVQGGWICAGGGYVKGVGYG